MEEEWKKVPSVPGILASSWGRVQLIPVPYVMTNGAVRVPKTKPRYGSETKASKTARHTYYGLQSRRYGNLKVHRLVCEAFHGPPPHKNSVVIHIDENALNNRPENLRWGTQKENLNMPGFIAYCRSRTGENSPAIKGRKKRHP